MRSLEFGELIVLPLLFFVLLLVALLIVVAIVAFFVNRMNRSTSVAIERGLAQQREALQQEVRTLLQEVRGMTPPPPAEAPPPAPVAAPPRPRISEDKLMILGAVLACHFGKRVKIRSARVISVGSGSNVWSQQGRAAVQASHSSLY